MADTLDPEVLLAELYSSAPEDFVNQRKEAARALKAAGQRDDADAVARAAKPSVSAWAVNVLAQRDPAAIDAVVEQGDRLRRAQAKGAAATEMRDAQRARRDAIRSATSRAAELSGRSLSEAHRTEIAETLEAASADPAAADDVRAGRLVKPLAVPSGFEQFGALTLVPGGRAERAATKPDRRRKPEAADAATAAAEEESIRARHAMLQAEAEAAEASAEAARAETAALRERVHELEAERDRLANEQREVESQLKAAAREVRDAERAEQQAKRRAARAAARADEARPPR